MQKKTFNRHLRETMQMAIPVIIGQLGHIMMGVIDNMMVGRVSPIHLAAAAIANGVFFIIMVIGIGITYALSPLVSIAIGSGRKEECSEILRNGLIINMICGILLMIINYFTANCIVYMGQKPEVTRLAIQYGHIIGLSTIPMMLFQTYRQFIEGMGIMRPAMFITIFMNLVHAFMNYLLIFGSFGFPRWELNGAGTATVISRTLMALTIMYFVTHNRRFSEFDRRIFVFKINKKRAFEILRIGLASGFQYFFEVACFVFAAIMVGWIGAYPLAAHQIALNIASVTYMAVVGVSSAAAIRVGKYFGAKEYLDTRSAGSAALLLGILFMTVSGLMMILLNTVLPTLYVDNPAVRQIASQLLIIAAMFQVFDGSQAVGLGILRGLTEAKFPTMTTFIAYWVIGIPIAHLLGFWLRLGVIGIWIGLLIGLAASAVLLVSRFYLRIRQMINQQERV